MRVIIAGTGSNSGKTTVALGLMRKLKNRGLNVQPFKVGPDYIDPGFHTIACGRESDNLDSFLMKKETVRSQLAKGEKSADIAVIEGVMGYYDGMDDFAASTYEMARITETPVLLVQDAGGAAASCAAVVKGFQTLVPDSRIAGVIVNRVAGERHYQMVRDAVQRYTGLPCLGYMQKDAGLSLPDRHLGLVPAKENPKAQSVIERAAECLVLDEGTLKEIAAAAPALQEKSSPLPDFRGFRLGYALDEAFHFYYPANLAMLREAGMELVPFSPLRDEALPENLDGLYIGGGYPEVFKEQLSRNEEMRHGILSALSLGLPCYAECGGLMYLGESIDDLPMVGFLEMRVCMTDRLQRFGYVMEKMGDGLVFPGHSFHYSRAEEKTPVKALFTVWRPKTPDSVWRDGYKKNRAIASYTHLHFLDYPELLTLLWRKQP